MSHDMTVGDRGSVQGHPALEQLEAETTPGNHHARSRITAHSVTSGRDSLCIFAQHSWRFVTMLEICNNSHFLKVMTLLNTKTNVAILIENFLAAILDFEYGRHQISIFVDYSVTK